MASEVCIDSPQDEKKRKLQESSFRDMDVDPASKRPCREEGDLQAGLLRAASFSPEGQGFRQQPYTPLQSDTWEDAHQQTEAQDEQVKLVDWGFLPRTIRRAGSEPHPETELPAWGSGGLTKKASGLTHKEQPPPGMREKNRNSWGPGSSKDLRAPVLASQPSLTSPVSSQSPGSCSSLRSKRSFDDVDREGSTSGAGVSGVSHEGGGSRATTSGNQRGTLSPTMKHRRILEEESGSSENGDASDGEAGKSAVFEQLQDELPKGGASSWREGGGSKGSNSGKPQGSSVESASGGELFMRGRRQMPPPSEGLMKRSGSRNDLIEEKRPSGAGVPLFERLTRGLPPNQARLGESVGSEKSDGGRGQENLRRKELESLPPVLRANLFPMRSDSGLSGLGTSDRKVNSQGLGVKDGERMLGGGGFKQRPPAGVGGGPVNEVPGAARFVLQDGVKLKKAVSDSMVLPGPTLKDEPMPERTMHSVSITSAHGRKGTVEDEFEAYFAQMGISM